jgi:osmotically inducible lipoprotein OsmB
MKRIVAPAVLLLALATAGCSGMNHTQQRVLSGGAIGAGIGAVGTALTGGCVACGAAIGGAVGAGAGYIYDQTRRH